MTSREDRVHLAKHRIRNILQRHTIALFRTLEQKIADAGPTPQRINPHILTVAKVELQKSGELVQIIDTGSPWFHLKNAPADLVKARLREQTALYARLRTKDLTNRIGQTLEVAIYKSLCQQKTLAFHGGFRDLADHDDATMYSKDDPPSDLNGRFIPKGKKLDFLVRDPSGISAGIEAKNLREWLYPDRPEVVDLLFKSCCLDVVPVLIARRLPFVTFKVLSPCGVVFHQTYNQLYPLSEAAFAEQIRHKNSLGYHDIRLGSDPDKRLLRFIHDNLPTVLPAAKENFDRYKDLLAAYAGGHMEYVEFAARVRRRSAGANEDYDDPPEPDYM